MKIPESLTSFVAILRITIQTYRERVVTTINGRFACDTDNVLSILPGSFWGAPGLFVFDNKLGVNGDLEMT